MLKPLAIFMLLVAPIPGLADEVWLQLAADRDRARAEATAQQLASVLPGLSLRRLGQSWLVVTYGPLQADEGRRLRAELLAQGEIPADSYLSDGTGYGDVLWQAGEVATRSSAADETRPNASAFAEVQRALALRGAYAGPLDGQAGPRTQHAIARWQSAQGFVPTGSLTEVQRTELLAPLQEAEATMGFAAYENAEAGIAVDLPFALVEENGRDAPFLYFTAKAESGVSLRLISLIGDPAELRALYRLLELDPVMPQTGYRSLEPQEFVLMGSDAKRTSYAWAEAKDGTIKGFLLVWPSGDLARRDIALSRLRSSFAPQPVGHALSLPETPPMTPTALKSEHPLWTQTGLWLRRNLLLTASERLAMCDRLEIDGDTGTIKAQRDSLALIEIEGAPLGSPSMRLSSVPLVDGNAVTLAGYGGHSGSLATPLPGTINTPSDSERLTISADLLPGDTGAPIFLDNGEVAGMVLNAETGEAASAAAIASFLTTSHTEIEMSSEALPDINAVAVSKTAERLTRPITCWP